MQFFSINQLPSMNISFPDFSSNFSVSGITDRVIAVAKGVFENLAGYSKTYNQFSEEGNLKVFALVSCVILFVVILANIIFKNGKSIVPPPTPFQPAIKKREGGD